MAGPEPERQDADGTRHYSAEAARGGEVVLRSRLSRSIFVGGLVLALAIGLILYVWAWP